MKTDYLRLYAIAKATHTDAYNLMQRLKDSEPTARDMQELADLAYVLREVSNLADDVRKEADALHSLCSSIACAQWIAERQHGLNPQAAPIKTDYCTASPDVKMNVSLPQRDTEEYTRLMRSLGIPDETQQYGVVRPHWPSIRDYVSQLLSEGYPLPDGLQEERVTPHYSLKIRGTKGLSL